MSRILLLALAVVVFVWLLRRALGSRKSGDPTRGAAEAAVPDLVVCANCGVHLPRGEAFAEEGVPGEVKPAPDAGRFFCSEEHRRAGLR